MTFQAGDIVYIAEEHKFTHVTGLDGPLTVLESTDRWTKVEGPDTHGPKEIFTCRFEKRDRTEGAEIRHEDIRIGDTIRNTYVSEDMKLTREGTVAATGSAFSGSTALWTADSMRIDVDYRSDTYTLIKAAPEVDEVLERVKSAGRDKIVEITREDGFRVAKKHTSLWTVYAPEGWVYKTNEEFAEYIRGAEVVWHG